MPPASTDMALNDVFTAQLERLTGQQRQRQISVKLQASTDTNRGVLVIELAQHSRIHQTLYWYSYVLSP